MHCKDEGRTGVPNFALGIPIGMGIGIAMGSGMDKKAFKEGRQLDIEVNR